MSINERHLELWTDSFHEGDWAAKSLSNHWDLMSLEFLSGFIPQYKFNAGANIVSLTIFGSYKSWSPLPKAIKDLLEWGKPDLVVYDSDAKQILFAAEETAATPTGNQALQRCERLYGAVHYKIPFLYLLPEFGIHRDGGVRRDSIWPTLQAIALTLQHSLPATVVHYGDRETPDSYSAGEGSSSLSRTLWLILRRWLGENVTSELEHEIALQYARMLAFIRSQHGDMGYFLPQEHLYDDDQGSVSQAIALRAAGEELKPILFGMSAWPLFDAMPANAKRQQKQLSFRVADKFLEGVSQMIMQKKAYVVTGNGGSRPQPSFELKSAIEEQRRLFLRDKTASPDSFTLDIVNFPATPTGLRHVVTTLRSVFLVDHLKDLLPTIDAAFGSRATDVFQNEHGEQSVFLFVCNSVAPGRIFGDPYTGEIAAYVPVFALAVDGSKSRRVIAYYPHQAHTQLLERAKDTSKGVRIMRELLDYAIFHSGYTIAVSQIAL